MPQILLGTSGWDYPEWVGPVYPKRGVPDKLRFYAERFPIVEVNSTFYRLPPVGVAASWARRTPKGFRFAAKFPQTITHDLRLVGAEEELRRFVEVVRPIQEAGKFVAALLQLPPSLPFESATVRGFYASLPRDLPVAVEFRERSWLSEESFALLREFGLAYVVVDEPLLPVQLDVTAPFSYVRWHGHGRRLWYDYTYRAEELEAWKPRVQQLAEKASTVYGFFNNHFRGDAAMNAQSLTDLLGLPPPAWSSRLDLGSDAFGPS
ncbi:MAG TPA: DUF72 domain-containing protein [Thermoplasmata archaeon]|nr:DUF72 domain-containing protein [Thermoplasmata archaeon]